MDMGTSTMDGMATATSSGAAAATTTAMSMKMGGACKISVSFPSLPQKSQID
jgi:hypothetical protein